LLIFTDKNSPHEPGTYEFQQCFVRAKDLNQADIMCVLVPMIEAFDVDVFYKEFLCTALDCDVEDLEQANPTRDIETLTKRIFRQDYRKRVNHHLRWQLGGNLALGVGVYSLTRKKFYMKKVRLQRDTNEVIVAKRSTLVTTLDEHNQEEVETRRLQPGEVKKQIFIGDEFVTLSAEEYQNMRQMTQPGCRLLGFKPMSTVNPNLHAQGPLFLFADETLIKGSNKLFASLWKRCLAKERVAICLLTLRRSTWPKFVALVPQNEIHNADNDMVRPNGFRVEFLPNAEDIRQLSIFDGPSPSVTAEQLDLMKKITKKLRFRYSPSQFEEPTLITRYTNIEAIVFESSRVSEIEDTTLPDREYQDSKIQQLVQEVTTIFGEDLQIGGAKKRREPVGDGPREKRARNNNETQLDVLETVRSGNSSSLTVAMLKQHLTALGCKNLTKMNKADLIQKVTEMDPGV
jgi:ATP-dependent DNA helicase 2 subunit 1